MTGFSLVEDLIDREGLGVLLSRIAEICAEKAEHVRSNWQDEALAKRWARAGTLIDRTAQRLPELP